MAEPITIVGIDVGTTKICTLVGEMVANERPRIIGVGTSPSRGLKKAVVVDLAQATDSIRTSVRKAEQISGYQIESAYVSIGGGHISAINSRGMVSISRSQRGITQADVDRALDAARAVAIPHNREVIHVIPRGYVVDGQDGIKDPIGMQGVRLEVEAHIITASESAVSNLVRCVRDAGIRVDDLVVQSLASGEAVLRESERDMGVVVADVGGGTTDIGIFIDGSIWHTHVLTTGGEHVTSDVVYGLSTPAHTAEELKIKYGHALAASLPADEVIEVTPFGDGARQTVSRLRLAEVIEARAEEILMLILREIKRSGYDGLLPAGLVLCGGSAHLAGFKELAGRLLDLPVRIGAPHDLQGLTEVVETPAYATAVGLLLWAMKQEPKRIVPTRPKRPPSELWKKVRDLLRAFLPG